MVKVVMLLYAFICLYMLYRRLRYMYGRFSLVYYSLIEAPYIEVKTVDEASIAVDT